jgi:ubiquitin carboxyl-terminal hydrolase 5/13
MEKGEKGEGEDGWILFNDEKVVKADQESVDDLKKYGYLYFFERVRGRV